MRENMWRHHRRISKSVVRVSSAYLQDIGGIKRRIWHDHARAYCDFLSEFIFHRSDTTFHTIYILRPVPRIARTNIHVEKVLKELCSSFNLNMYVTLPRRGRLTSGNPRLDRMEKSSFRILSFFSFRAIIRVNISHVAFLYYPILKCKCYNIQIYRGSNSRIFN